MKRKLTNAEWERVSPLIPGQNRLGRRRKTDMRAVISAIRYRTQTGCVWRDLPDCYPPWETVYGWWKRLSESGVMAQIEPHI